MSDYPEVATMDEQAMALTVWVINCQGQVILEQAGASLWNMAVSKEEFIDNQLHIWSNDYLLMTWKPTYQALPSTDCQIT